MEQWKTLASRTILDRGKYLRVEERTLELPGGRLIDAWPWVVTPDYANVVAVTPQGLFVCFRQVKYGVEGTSLAPVGGYLEPDEEPLAAARRELLEETGYRAPTWHRLGSYQVDGNRGMGMAHMFLALDAVHVTSIQPDDLEEQELVLLTLGEVSDALVSNEFKVLPWATAMALALLMLDR
ncbi:MAG: NUDIX hydrolase [Chloroflexi bacterium]|nr:NUDIX hydrolase [Chloroflexota bacterium]